MLDRTRYTDRDIKIGRNHLAGLPNLPVIRRIAGIDGRARCADSGAQRVSQCFYHGKVFLATNAAPAGHHHSGRCQLGPVRGGNLVFDPLAEGRIIGGRNRLDRGGAAVGSGIESRGANADHLLAIGGFHRLDGVAGIDRALEGFRIHDP